MTFRDDLVVLSSGVGKSSKFLTFSSNINYLEKLGTKYPLTQGHVPEERMRHQHRSENLKPGKVEFVPVDCDQYQG